MDRLKKLNKELIELGSEINAKREEVLSILSSDDDKEESAVDSACTELKNLQSKHEEMNKRFLVTVNVFVAQKKAEKEKIEQKTNKKKACGLCGKTKKLTKSECCGNWICDDSDQYVMFSYSKNSCYRNHHRFTLCNYHDTESHSGKWQVCEKCKKDMEPEMYTWYATNNYNFEKLDIPKIPIKCANCDFVSFEVEDFASSISKGNSGTKWFCTKQECLQAL